jgi:hypothetical protein
LKQLEAAATDWLRFDRDAAAAWLSQSGLPEESLKRLLPK